MSRLGVLHLLLVVMMIVSCAAHTDPPGSSCPTPSDPSDCVFGDKIYQNDECIKETSMVLQCVNGGWKYTAESNCCEPTTPIPTTPALTTQASTTPNPEDVCDEYIEKCMNDTCYMFFFCPKTWHEAFDFCCSSGWSLAAPYEDFDWFNDLMPTYDEYWMNVRPIYNTSTWYWFQKFQPMVTTTPDQWDGNTPDAPPNCASLLRYAGLMSNDCDNEFYFVCEMERDLCDCDQRKAVEEVHVPPRVGPGRGL